MFVLYDASQAPGAHWDLPHRVGSAPLTSLSSLDKDGRNLSLSAPTPTPQPPPLFSLPLSHSCIISLSSVFPPFCLPASCSIFVPSWFFLFFLLAYSSHSHLSPSLSFSFVPLPCIVSLSFLPLSLWSAAG